MNSRGVTYLTVPPRFPPRELHPPTATINIEDGRVLVASDALGLKGIFTVREPRFSAISTSALVLGAVVEAALDERAWAHLALLGFLLGNETPFDGVRKLDADHVASVRDGKLELFNRPDATVPTQANGVRALKRSVEELLESDPDAGLELSGGLDSRVILAAMPRAARRGRKAVTIDTGTGADAAVARQIATTEGLQHLVVPEWPLGELDPDEVRARVERGAKRRDCQSNALAAAVLDRAEERMPGEARFTGVNGEYVRGFYYPGTSRWSAVSQRSVSRLVRWRMLTNERVAGGLFTRGWEGDHLGELIRYLTADLAKHSQRLRTATDEFYLHDRVVRWAGPGYSHAATERRVLAPFLHPLFLRWATPLDTRVRGGSRLLATLLVELDRELATLPLAGGLDPLMLASSRSTDQVRRTTATAKKFARKVTQRITGTSRPPSGTNQVLDSLRSSWRGHPPFEPLAGLSFIRDAQLESWSEDLRDLDPATASFVVNLSIAVAFRAKVDTTSSSDRHQQFPDGQHSPTGEAPS